MQTDSTFAVIFFTRNTRKNSGNLSIYARITINGKRTEISLKRNVPVNHWDVSKGRARRQCPKPPKTEQLFRPGLWTDTGGPYAIAPRT